MSFDEIEVLGQLSDMEDFLPTDDQLMDLLSNALELADGDQYEAITFLTENSTLPHQRLQKLYKGFLKSA